MIYRELTLDEIAKFKKWARDNFFKEGKYPLKTTEDINETWHPVIQAECFLMVAEEKAKYDKFGRYIG